MVINLKTLYISDLDGTLLNSQAELSLYTVNVLNKLIEQGENISIATARTSATALKMLESVNINTPIVLMNGACIYDIQNKCYIKTEIINENSVLRILDILSEQNQPGFLYTMQDEKLLTYYENLNSSHMKAFHDERVLKFGKTFVQVNSFQECINLTVLYFSACDKLEKLQPVYDRLIYDNEIHVEFYRDVYMEDYWYLEVCSANASKYNAVKFLREHCRFDNVISFGDNLNDLPMFNASDQSYAVSNAKNEVKAKATAVIGSNNGDGVARYLENILKSWF